MNGRPRVPAYVELARSFIQELRFRKPANRPLSEWEAQVWLQAEAAWAARGSRTAYGIIHNERGELSTTHRILAREWAWSKGKVGRFLTRLAAKSVISVRLVRCGAESGAEFSASTGYARSLITLLNYDECKNFASAQKAKVGQSLGQNSPTLPGILVPLTTPTKHKTKEMFKRTSRGGGFVNANMPRHGKQSRGGIFCRHGTDDWEHHAADVESVHGWRPVPTRYLDGRGNWFRNNGERSPAMAGV